MVILIVSSAVQPWLGNYGSLLPTAIPPECPSDSVFQRIASGSTTLLSMPLQHASTLNGPIVCFQWLHWDMLNFASLLIVGGSTQEKLLLPFLRVFWGLLLWEPSLFSFSLEFSRPGAANSNAYMGQASAINEQSHCRCETRRVVGTKGAYSGSRKQLQLETNLLWLCRNTSWSWYIFHFLKKKKRQKT